MRLSDDEVDRFYGIWKPLLLLVNRRLRLVPDMLDPGFTGPWHLNKVMTLRDALWADDTLREAFVTENPAGLSGDDLGIATGWRHRVSGSFAVLRHLKRYSVFIGEDSTAYGVLGLASPLSEVTPFAPCYLKAVLLPFAGRVIYDSLLVPYNVHLGPGIRADLGRTYADARERGVVTSLPRPLPSADPAAVRSSNAKVVAAFRTHLFGTGLSERVVGRDTAAVEGLARHLLDRSPPRSLRELDAGAVREFLVRGGPDRTNPTGLKRFVRFLRDTGRMGDGGAAAALDVLAGRG
jgi:hypothetical protein